ncbi:hypothetical protein K466DRAFT_650096 [Polyporus arcularius HHB13444]|uniref:F-box domain-containing protein n=1 Tax=Polyporus arcularius HHB13444 TaxID=1314778 RepID=A0A5C3PTV5_9APHY|nr:hypothetical protein K466DRAFT_650096 [Polyporus arcularius HHB13444]
MLWGHLPSIVPLIFTMPRDLWVIEPREEKGGCRTLVKFTRPLLSSDYIRFLGYACRVKALHDTSHWRGIALDESAWTALEQFRPTPHLLPRLRSLSLTVNCSVALIPIHILISSVLKQLTVYVRRSGGRGAHLRRGLRRLFEKLHVTNPPIRHISLEFNHCSRPKYQTLLTALLCLKSLTTVQTSYTPVGASTLAILSHLPHLRDLQVRVLGSGQHTVDAFARMRSTRPFRSLAKVSYTVDDMAVVHCLLRSAASRSLTYIDICMLADVSPEDAQEFMSIVALHHSGLEHLQLRLRDPMPRDPNDPHEVAPDQETLPSDILGPLLALPQLSTVNMASCPIVVNDSLVARMAIAWPDISTLELCSSFHGFDDLGVRPPAHVRLAGLVPLFESCKKLQRLGLPLDTTMTTASDSADGSRCDTSARPSACPTIPRLADLCVGWSKIEEADVAPVASFLSDHLPLLSKVTDGWESAFVYGVVADEHTEGAWTYETRWRQVAALVRGLSLVRQQERNWARRMREVLPVPAAAPAMEDLQGMDKYLP